MRVPDARRGDQHRGAGARARSGTSRPGFANAVLRKIAGHDLDDLDGQPLDASRGCRAALAPGLDRRARSPSALGRDPTSSTACCAADNERRPWSPWSPGPGCPRSTSCRRRAGSPVSPYAVDARPVRRPGRAAGGPRGPGRRAGRGLPAGRARPGPAPRSRAATSAGWTCAPARAARPRCSLRSRPSAGPGCWPTSGRRTGPSWSPRRSRAGRRVDVVTGDGAAPAVARRARSTGCWSTRRAPGSARCAAARRAAGGGRRDDVDGPGAAAGGAARRSALDAVRPGRSGRSTRPARRSVAETAGVVDAVLASRDDVRLEDAPLAAARRPTDAESAHLAGAVQLWPHRHGTDAMFLALLRALSCGPRPWPDLRAHHGHPDHAEHPERRPSPPRRRGRAGSRAPTGCTST